MGTVWLAEDDILSRQVAVKEVSPPADMTERERDLLRERTLREAQTAARLSHPNVVTIYDVVEDDGRPWIVMELVRSRSLREVVEANGPLTAQQAARVGVQVLTALSAAHALGIMHRDVKPGNVLIDADGRAILADFGIARTQDSPALTTSGVLVGSPSYIAPERARGERGGPESDLWSLGATLYALVEGRPAYDRAGALATLMAVVNEDPDPPSRAGVLWPVIRGLLDHVPARRLGPAEAERMLRQIAESGDGSKTAPLPAAPPGLADDGKAQRTRPGSSLESAEHTRTLRPWDAVPPAEPDSGPLPSGPGVLPDEPDPDARPEEPAPQPLPREPGPGALPDEPDPHAVPAEPDSDALPDEPDPHALPAEPDSDALPEPEPHALPEPEPHALPAEPDPHALPAEPDSDALPDEPDPHALPEPEPQALPREPDPHALPDEPGPLPDEPEPHALPNEPEPHALPEPEPQALPREPDPHALPDEPDPHALPDSPGAEGHAAAGTAGPVGAAGAAGVPGDAEQPSATSPPDSPPQADPEESAPGPAGVAASLGVAEPRDHPGEPQADRGESAPEAAGTDVGLIPGIPFRPGTAPETAPVRTAQRRKPRRAWVVGGAAALVLVAGVVISMILTSHHRAPVSANPPHSTTRPASSHSASPTPSVTSAAPTTAQPTSPAPTSGSGPLGPATIPAGYHGFRNYTGFSIAVPNGWRVSHQGHYVYLLPPSGAQFLLIDQSDHPQSNPLKDWQQQEANRASSYPGYHRIRLEAIRYPQAEKAADWEFTYFRQGVLTHVLNRNVLANSHHAYALYWSTPESEWGQSWHIFKVLEQTFRPASP